MCWGCGAVDEVSRVKFKECMAVEVVVGVVRGWLGAEGRGKTEQVSGSNLILASVLQWLAHKHMREAGFSIASQEKSLTPVL